METPQHQPNYAREGMLRAVVRDILITNAMENDLEATIRQLAFSRTLFSLGSGLVAPVGSHGHILARAGIAESRAGINHRLHVLGGLPISRPPSAALPPADVNLVAWKGPAMDDPAVHLWNPSHNPEMELRITSAFFDSLRNRYLSQPPVQSDPTAQPPAPVDWRNEAGYL